MPKNLSFETAMQQLEEILQKLENSDTTLEESLKLYEKGAALTTLCYEKLQTAEQTMTQLSATMQEGSDGV